MIRGTQRAFDDTHNHVADSANKKTNRLGNKDCEKADDEENRKTTWKLI
jgi:hypothetical protein